MTGVKNIGHLEATLGLNDALFTAGLSKARASMMAAGTSMKRVGRSMTTTVSLPLVLIGGAAVKMAASFEKSMSKIEGQVGIAADKVQAMKKDVLALAGPTARSPQELADALFFVTSAGLRGADAMEVLRKSARGAAAGFGETKVVADLVTSATNAYGISNLSAAQAMDTLAAAVREGKSEALDIADSMGQVLPIASNLGVSFNEVGASIASMSRTGTVAKTAVIQLRQILFSILKPSQMSEDAFKAMDTSSAKLRDVLRGENGLLNVLSFLKDELNADDQAMAKAFPNVRALSGALDIMGANAEENIGIFKRMRDNTGDADAAFDAAAKTLDHKFNAAMAEFKTAMIEIGTLLIPFVTNLVSGFKEVVMWFKGLSTWVKKTILVFSGFLAIAGPVLIVLGSMATLIAAISWPVLAVVAAIATLGTAIVWVADNWKAITERLSDWGWWRNMLISMVQFLIKWNPVSLLIEGYNALASVIPAINEIVNPFEAMSGALGLLKNETKEFKHEFTSLGQAITNTLSSISGVLPTAGAGPEPSEGRKGVQRDLIPVPKIDTIADIMDRVAAKIKEVREETAKMGKEVINMSSIITGALIGAFTMFGNTISDILTGDAGAQQFFTGIIMVVADFLTALGQAMIAAGVASIAFKDLFVSGIGAVIAGGALIATAAVVRGLLQNASSGMQGMRSGGFVTEGGMFQLHKDEKVALPAGSAVMSQRASRMGNGGGEITTSIGMRKLIIELNREQQRLGR